LQVGVLVIRGHATRTYFHAVQDEVIGRYARHKVGWAYAPATDDIPPEVKAHINQIYAKVGLDDRQL